MQLDAVDMGDIADTNLCLGRIGGGLSSSRIQTSKSLRRKTHTSLAIVQLFLWSKKYQRKLQKHAWASSILTSLLCPLGIPWMFQCAEFVSVRSCLFSVIGSHLQTAPCTQPSLQPGKRFWGKTITDLKTAPTDLLLCCKDSNHLCVCVYVFVDDFEEHLGMQNVCVEHLGTHGILYIWWTDPAGDSWAAASERRDGI